MPKGDHRAMPHPDGGWQHKVDGNERATSLHDTQAEAWEAAKEAARQDESEAFLTGRGGQIRERNTYGHDPRQIKG